MNWVLFPVYGLTISEPDAWLADPLFKDATLVSREAFVRHLRNQLGEQFHPLLSHGKLSESIDIKTIGLPAQQLVEMEPASYIAVRDRGDAAKNGRRAVEIRAFLSATLALRGPRLQAISGNPTQVAWFMVPLDAVVRSSEPPKASIAPVFNEHVLLEKLEVAQADLRDSLKTGKAIPNNRKWYWDIHESHPVCQLFLSDISKFEKRLLNAALQIQEAGCASSYDVQVQMAVAAFEVLLKPDSFPELRRMLTAFFPGEDQAKRVERLLTTRHRITHEGGGRGDDEAVKESARHGLVYAWTMLDIATAYNSMSLATSFDEYIRMLVSARDLDEKFARIAEDAGYSALLRQKIPTFHKRLTLRQKFEGESAV
jgi:hypothetical protein